MIKEKEMKLKQKIKSLLKEVTENKAIKDDIAEEFNSRNIGVLKAMWLTTGNIDVDALEDTEDDVRFLFLFSIALEKALKKRTEINFNAKEYFTDVEYKKWIDYKEINEIKTSYPIVIEGVQKLSDGIWQTVISAQKLNEWDTDNLLIYNFKTQRNPKITVSGEKINIDKLKVKEIKERMLNGEQFPDAIKLNVLHSGEDYVEYDEKNETLIIHSGLINIFDGYHRKVSNSLALEENPNLQFNWSIVLTNFSETKARDYMMQINKQKPIKKEYVKTMDYSKMENRLVDVIADDKLSLLSAVMKDDDAYIRNNRALTKKSIISLAIAEQYKEEIQEATNIRNIAKWIIEATDYMMGLYADAFVKNPYEVKKTSMINNKNIFFGYIALAKAVQNKDGWKQKIKDKMASIDFSIDNPLWRELGLTIESLGKDNQKVMLASNNDANKTTRNKLYKLLTEGV